MVWTGKTPLGTKEPESTMSHSLSAISPFYLGKLSPEHKELFQCITQNFEKLMVEKDKKIECLENHVEALRDNVDALETEHDDNDAYLQRETLIQPGKIPDGTWDEDCKSIVTNMLQKEVKLKISPHDISIAHRVGSKK